MNYLALFVASMAAMAIGMVWYSPLVFGKAWLKALGWSEKDLKQKKKTSKSMSFLLSTSFVCSLVTAALLSFFLSFYPPQQLTVLLGMQVAFHLWLAFTAAFELPVYLYEQRPLRLFAINAGHQLVSALVIAAVLAAWM